MVLHGEHRQLEADHPADLARPQAAGVDDVLGVDRRRRSRCGRPTCRPARCVEADDRRVLVDLGAGQLGALDVGVRDAGRVDVALDRVVQRADEVLRVEQREEVLRPPRA